MTLRSRSPSQKGWEVAVGVGSGTDALTRFANNTIHQNVAEHMLGISVRAVVHAAQTPHQERVGLELREVTVDLLLARLSHAGGRQRDVHGRRTRPQGANGAARPNEVEKVEMDDDDEADRAAGEVPANEEPDIV